MYADADADSSPAHTHAPFPCKWPYVAARNGFQFYGAAMEKESLAQGRGFYELLKRIAAHRHGKDFNADINNQYSYSRVGLWCAKTAWACWRQALMVEFVNNREKVTSEAVAKAIDRTGDGVLTPLSKCYPWTGPQRGFFRILSLSFFFDAGGCHFDLVDL